MSNRTFSHIRIYPNPAAGYDIHLRHRGGLTKHETYQTMDDALRAAHALNGPAQNEPVFVYSRDLDAMVKAHRWERLALNPPRHPTTSIGE